MKGTSYIFPNQIEERLKNVDKDRAAGRNMKNIEWVEFASLKDLFHFLVTHAIPMQQTVSIIHYKDYTYVMAPYGDIIVVFFTKEPPQARVYRWNTEMDEFVPSPKLDRSSYNIIVQDALHDSIIEKQFYT